MNCNHFIFFTIVQIQKNVEPRLSLVPRIEVFALPELSKQATSKALRYAIYKLTQVHAKTCTSMSI